MLRLLFVLFVSLLALAAGAEPLLPESFSARFTVSKGGFALGETHWSLTPTGEGQYIFESKSTAAGLWSLLASGERVERSLWTRYREGLRPISYQYRRTDKEGRNVDIAFDWERGIAINTRKGHTRELKLKTGTLDKLVYFLALMADLAHGHDDLVYQVADGKKIKRIQLSILGRESLPTPLGDLETIKVRRQARGGKRQTTLWAAPSLSYLPVKVEHREKDGDVMTMMIKAVSGIAAR